MDSSEAGSKGRHALWVGLVIAAVGLVLSERTRRMTSHGDQFMTELVDDAVMPSLLMQEHAALVALLTSARADWRAIADAIEATQSAIEVLRTSVEQPSRFASETVHEQRLHEALATVEEWDREGLSLVSLLDADYPEQLREIHQRPPLLMYRGVFSVDDARGVAVVGTRHPSREGAARAFELGRELARCGVPVISGLAAGIDTEALTGSLDVAGRTVAVIGTGLRRSYPAQNAGLQERIAREGLLLSQFLPDAPPAKYSFPMRNAVMSGYAAATVVVEAAWKSGARMQARLALEHGRPVFLLRSLLVHDWAQEYATRSGVTVVAGIDDLLPELEKLSTDHDELVWD